MWGVRVGPLGVEYYLLPVMLYLLLALFRFWFLQKKNVKCIMYSTFNVSFFQKMGFSI